MQRTCASCRASFEITQQDLAFYDTMSPTFAGKKQPIPPPTLCPQCRAMRRLAFRNERSLHRRACDRCKQSIISVYREGAPYTVYCPDCWWSDAWEGLEYAVPWNTSCSVLENIDRLWHKVPLLAL